MYPSYSIRARELTALIDSPILCFRRTPLAVLSSFLFPNREAENRSTNLRAVPDLFRSSDNANRDPEGLTMTEAPCRREMVLEIPAETVQKAVARVAKEFARVA